MACAFREGHLTWCTISNQVRYFFHSLSLFRSVEARYDPTAAFRNSLGSLESSAPRTIGRSTLSSRTSMTLSASNSHCCRSLILTAWASSTSSSGSVDLLLRRRRIAPECFSNHDLVGCSPSRRSPPSRCFFALALAVTSNAIWAPLLEMRFLLSLAAFSSAAICSASKMMAFSATSCSGHPHSLRMFILSSSVSAM